MRSKYLVTYFVNLQEFQCNILSSSFMHGLSTGYRVKVQERGGTQLRRILVKKNPFPEIPCGREFCMMCKNGKGGQCRRRNISYKTTCDNCKANNLQAGVENTPETVAHYIGESFRSGAERSANHISDYLNQKEESHIWKHKSPP